MEPSPVRRPYPGPGQAEVDVDDAGAVELHQGDDAGVGGGVEEEGGEALRGGLQGSLDRGQEVGEVGEAVPPVVEGASKGLGECGAGAGEKVREVSPGGGAGGEAAGSGLSRPVALEPVRPVTALSILAWTVAARTAVGEEPQVVHRGWAPRPRGMKEGRRKMRLGRACASATSLECQ